MNKKALVFSLSWLIVIILSAMFAIWKPDVWGLIFMLWGHCMYVLVPLLLIGLTVHFVRRSPYTDSPVRQGMACGAFAATNVILLQTAIVLFVEDFEFMIDNFGFVLARFLGFTLLSGSLIMLAGVIVGAIAGLINRLCGQSE